jgi:prefoldin subunit 5
MKLLGKKKKDKKKESKLEQKYGVIKDEIPEQKVEEETKAESHKLEEKPKPDDVSNVDLLMKIEKLEGKFSLFDEYKSAIDEKITHLSEQIGELRSSFLELDKRFTELDTSAETALDAIKEIMPEKIQGELEKKESQILKIGAEIETIRSVLEGVKQNNQKVMELLDKVKNIENIVKMFEKVEAKIGKIDETKYYVDRMVGKSEAIFSELDMKLKEFETQSAKITSLDSLSKDLVRMLDEVSMRMNKFVKEDEVGRMLRGTVEKRLGATVQKVVKNNYERRMKETAKVVREINALLGGMGKMTPMQADETAMTSNIVDEKVDLYFKFLQQVELTIYLTNREEVSRSIENMRGIVDRMQELGLWNETTEDLLVKVYSWVGNSWGNNGHNDIKNMFSREISAFVMGDLRSGMPY